MASNIIDNSDEIILGSGDLFLCEYNGTIPEDTVIEADANRAGNIKGGASLEYSVASITVEDDKGRLKRTLLTKEDVKFKTGLITWSDNWLKALIPTARVDTTTKTGHRLIKLGGLSNQGHTSWLYRFVHTRDDGRKLRITVTGKNVGTVTLKFDTENPTTVDSEIAAESLDNEGTLVIYDDELPKA
jgi:hypothetical protein